MKKDKLAAGNQATAVVHKTRHGASTAAVAPVPASASSIDLAVVDESALLAD